MAWFCEPKRWAAPSHSIGVLARLATRLFAMTVLCCDIFGCAGVRPATRASDDELLSVFMGEMRVFAPAAPSGAPELVTGSAVKVRFVVCTLDHPYAAPKALCRGV